MCVCECQKIWNYFLVIVTLIFISTEFMATRDSRTVKNKIEFIEISRINDKNRSGKLVRDTFRIRFLDRSIDRRSRVTNVDTIKRREIRNLKFSSFTLSLDRWLVFDKRRLYNIVRNISINPRNTFTLFSLT